MRQLKPSCKLLKISHIFKKQFLKLGILKFCKSSDLKNNVVLKDTPHIVVDSVGFIQNKKNIYQLRIQSEESIIKILWTTSIDFAIYLTEILLNEPINFFSKMKKFLVNKSIQYSFY